MNESFGFGDSITAEDFIKNFYKSSDNNNQDGENKANFPWIIFLLLFMLFRSEGSGDVDYWKGKYDALKELREDERGPKNV